MFRLRINKIAPAFILALWVFASSAAANEPAPKLGDVLGRHRTALGELAAGNARWSGVVDENGIQGAYVLTADRRGRYRLDISLPLSSRAEGDDGNTGWRQDENGNVQLISGDRLRALGARLLGFNAFIADAKFHGDLGALGVVDGKSAYAVGSTLGRTALKIYVDAQTYLVDGVDLGDRTIRYVAYRKFGALEVPSKVVETRGSYTTTTTIDALAYNVASRDAFLVPLSRRPQFPAEQHDVAVNYDPLRGLIIVPASLNGKAARFLIDSGSTSSIIDIGAATRFGLATAGSARVVGAGVMTGKVARADALVVGGVAFHPFVLEAVPLSLPGVIAREGVDGVLGYDFLAQLVVRIAAGRGQIRLIEAPLFTYTGTGSILAMDEVDRVPRLQATVGNSDKVLLQVDTGSDANLVLFSDYADKHLSDFATFADLGQDYARGAGGAFPIRFMQLTRLNIGAFSVPDLITQIVVHPTGAFSPMRADGIIGMGTIGRFDAVFLDYPGKRLIFER